jgi:hypothetical protein
MSGSSVKTDPARILQTSGSDHLYIWTADGACISTALGVENVAQGDVFTASHLATVQRVDITKEAAIEQGLIVPGRAYIWTACGASISTALGVGNVLQGDGVTAAQLAALQNVEVTKEFAIENDFIAPDMAYIQESSAMASSSSGPLMIATP